MITVKKSFFCAIFIFLPISPIEPYKAFVIVPVADLFGQAGLAPLKSDTSSLPISGIASNGCSRIHQIIFNETVTVLEERDHEIRISIPNIFFEQPESETRFTEYWTYKQAVIAQKSLHQQNISLSLFPEPIDFTLQSKSSQKVVTLLFPYYEPTTQQTYSAGSRFVVNKIKNKAIIAYAYYAKKEKICSIKIPLHLCLVEEPKEPKDKIALFASLVQQWAERQNGFIPYVRGGCSFTMLCQNDDIIKKENAYYRPTYPHLPAPGFDCTGIIARATQICGIPYYFKNSTTLVKYLRSLEKEEAIENGDIIWIDGHTIIIADSAKNLCVEARGYDHGFGKIHALPIGKLFANLEQLEDVKNAMFYGKSVIRLDSSGNHAQIMPVIKILKLSSVWNQQKKSIKQIEYNKTT